MPRERCSPPGYRGFRCCLAVAACIALLIVLDGCGGRAAVPSRVRAGVPPRQLARIGYTIQVGAFAEVENAARLSETLRRHDLEATYFVASAGLYKVRFGDFASREAARRRAGTLRASGVIDEYFIVGPDEYAVAKRPVPGAPQVRDEIVKTARSFIGVPYLWGGASPETGFDCSGLAAACYQLNGFHLPRTSREQFRAGLPVTRDGLAKGDLVFFATSGWDKISHVGIYAGDGRFIHAPGRGKIIRMDAIDGGYFGGCYIGARSYL